jgi:hypothetical protein
VTGQRKLKPMTKADKGQFDEVLRRMIQKNPQKTAEIKKRVTRKKNPHEGPMEPEPIPVEQQPEKEN